MSATPNLNLPYIMAAQAQKHVTHNEAIRALDVVVQISVIDRNLTAPPLSPLDGDRYIVGASASGGWTGKSGQVTAFQDGAWVFYPPREGWLVWVADENVLIVHDGSAFISVGGGGGGVSLNPATGAMIGVNTAADTTNRLAVKSDAVLFSHDDVTPGSGDIQAKLNKSAAVRTASLVYQSNWSGRAELGLTGDDDFHFKVSADGAQWNEAIVIDRATGRVAFPQSSLASNLLFNLFKDAGRFGGTPEPQGASLASFAAPTYLQTYNGSAFAQGDKFIFNNSTYGGAAAALSADVNALVQKLKDTVSAAGTYARYGIEFYLLNITAGAGTASPLTAGGVLHYLAIVNLSVPAWPKSTIGYNVLAKTGGLAIMYMAGVDTYIDGIKIAAHTQISPADGWKQIVRVLNIDPRQYVGYDSNLLRLYATPAATFRLAAPFLMPGQLQITTTPFGVVPSLEAWR